MFGGARKVTDFIDFPVNGLNMAPFLVEAKEKDHYAPILYDLYAVSN